MKDRILSEPAFGLGLLVWIIAATVFPFELGMGGSPMLTFVGYLTVAGVLLAIADALLNSSTYHSLGDVVLQGLFWMIGLSIPALAAFAIGSSLAPASDRLEEGVCQMAGLTDADGVASSESPSETIIEDAFETIDDCELVD